jgi:hypothetical protein
MAFVLAGGVACVFHWHRANSLRSLISLRRACDQCPTLAPLAPHQPRPARDAADALESRGLVLVRVEFRRALALRSERVAAQ